MSLQVVPGGCLRDVAAGCGVEGPCRGPSFRNFARTQELGNVLHASMLFFMGFACLSKLWPKTWDLPSCKPLSAVLLGQARRMQIYCRGHEQLPCLKHSNSVILKYITHHLDVVGISTLRRTLFQRQCPKPPAGTRLQSNRSTGTSHWARRLLPGAKPELVLPLSRPPPGLGWLTSLRMREGLPELRLRCSTSQARPVERAGFPAHAHI